MLIFTMTKTKLDPNGPVPRGALDEAVDAILKGVEQMFAKLDKRLDRLEGGQQELKGEVAHLKDEVKSLNAELSDTPSSRAFNELKARVDEYHPLV